jgi:hypothetical protein
MYVSTHIRITNMIGARGEVSGQEDGRVSVATLEQLAQKVSSARRGGEWTVEKVGTKANEDDLESIVALHEFKRSEA